MYCEDAVSHYLSEYFGSCRGGVGPGAVTGVLAQIRRATRYRLVGFRFSGSAASIPVPSFDSRVIRCLFDYSTIR
jgi:hypothetical protein